MVETFTLPNILIKRSVEIERMSSHFAKLRTFNPPSGGFISTCAGIRLSFEVIGIAMTRSAGLRLSLSSGPIKQGRWPPCSRLLAGSRSVNHISPRYTLTAANYLSVLCPDLVRCKFVRKRVGPKTALPLCLVPGVNVGFERSKRRAQRVEEPVLLIFVQSFVQHTLHRRTFLPRQLSKHFVRLLADP